MDRRGRVHSKKYIPVYFIPMKGTMGIAAAQMEMCIRDSAKGSLDIFPYILKPKSRALLIGTRGGFRVGEALKYDASELVALESDPNICLLYTSDFRLNLKDLLSALGGSNSLYFDFC